MTIDTAPAQAVAKEYNENKPLVGHRAPACIGAAPARQAFNRHVEQQPATGLNKAPTSPSFACQS